MKGLIKMKFKDKKTGEIYKDIETAWYAWDCLSTTHGCGDGCQYIRTVCSREWCAELPKEAAKIMGYEVIEELPKKPRICEVLGVEVGQRFNFNDFPLCDPVTYFVDEDGNIRNVRGIKVEATELCYIINHAECIVRHTRFTPQEVEDAKTLKRLFGDYAIAEYGARHVFGGLRLNEKALPSLEKGRTYTLKEIIGGEE